MLRTVPRRLEALAECVALVREFLAAEGLDEEHAFSIDLVLEELFTNIVRHGRSHSDVVEVGLAHEGEDIRLVLREFDTDRFDPTEAPEVDTDAPIEDRRPGGLGIHFVRVLGRDFSYDWQDRVGTTTVLMRMDR